MTITKNGCNERRSFKDNEKENKILDIHPQ